MFGAFKPTPKPQRTNKRIFAAANIGGISTEVQIRICGMKCPVLREGGVERSKKEKKENLKALRFSYLLRHFTNKLLSVKILRFDIFIAVNCL